MFGFEIRRAFSPINRWGAYRFASYGNGTGVSPQSDWS